MSTPTPTALNEALGHTASDKRLEVLRRVGQTGSISQAARDAGISYKAAWQAIETLTHLSGLPLVDRSVGGSGGGGARVTPQGLQLLALADDLAQARAQVLARHAQGVPGSVLPPLNLGLRTSMRNQLPCVVDAVQSVASAPTVVVALRTPCGQGLTSWVTRESADLLGLAPTLSVFALCKATAVAVSPDEGVPTQFGAPPCCVLQGTVKDISPGNGTQEVALVLPSGHLWVGFAPPAHGLVVGQLAWGRFAPSAVVMGLAG